MNCEKLFYNDSYATTFTAEVIDCFESKGSFAIVLDKTLFYPEGGGQPCDHGVIRWDGNVAEIFDVREKNDIISHFSRTAMGSRELSERQRPNMVSIPWVWHSLHT